MNTNKQNEVYTANLLIVQFQVFRFVSQDNNTNIWHTLSLLALIAIKCYFPTFLIHIYLSLMD